MSTSPSRIRFYDDDPKNLVAVNKYFPAVECIHVPPTLLVEGNELKGPDEYFRHIEEHGGWDLAGEDADLAAVIGYLRRFGVTSQYSGVVQGLTSVGFSDIRTWVDSLPDPPAPYMQGTRVLTIPIRGKLFLDWDEVVSQLEGIAAPSTMAGMGTAGVTPLGFLKLCMGSRVRLVAMKELIAYLIDTKGMEVHIVTNNGACKENSVFQYVAQSLHPEITVNCCRDYRGGDKGFCVRSLGLTRMETVLLLTSFGTFKRGYMRKHGGRVSDHKIRAKYSKGLLQLLMNAS